jgi:hypothetical protein
MDVEVYEFEPGRWSYKIGGAASGETFPSRAAALIAAEQAKDKQAQAPEAPADNKGAADPLA